VCVCVCVCACVCVRVCVCVYSIMLTHTHTNHHLSASSHRTQPSLESSSTNYTKGVARGKEGGKEIGK